MQSIEKLYREAFGEEMSDRAKARALKMKDILGLSETDTLWTLLVTLEYYDRVYERRYQSIVNQSVNIIALAVAGVTLFLLGVAAGKFFHW